MKSWTKWYGVVQRKPQSFSLPGQFWKQIHANSPIRTLFHPAGSASMGKVVDSEMRAKGVKKLRVVDASVTPTPLACPIQHCVYTLAEQAVDMILAAGRKT